MTRVKAVKWALKFNCIFPFTVIAFMVLEFFVVVVAFSVDNFSYETFDR